MRKTTVSIAAILITLMIISAFASCGTTNYRENSSSQAVFSGVNSAESSEDESIDGGQEITNKNCKFMVTEVVSNPNKYFGTRFTVNGYLGRIYEAAINDYYYFLFGYAWDGVCCYSVYYIELNCNELVSSEMPADNAEWKRYNEFGGAPITASGLDGMQGGAFYNFMSQDERMKLEICGKYYTVVGDFAKYNDAQGWVGNGIEPLSFKESASPDGFTFNTLTDAEFEEKYSWIWS